MSDEMSDYVFTITVTVSDVSQDFAQVQREEAFDALNDSLSSACTITDSPVVESLDS